MKIKQASLVIEGVFSGLEFKFQTTSDSSIHYLVGNNGQGKTAAIQALYNALVGEMSSSNGKACLKLDASSLDGSQEEWTLNVEWTSPNSSKGGNIVGSSLSEEDLKQKRKAVYSDVRINFGSSNISSITAASVDKESPKEISSNLHQEIPQLLVNLKQQDSNLRSAWMEEQAGQPTSTIPKILPNEVMPRFVDAYNNIFKGEKASMVLSKKMECSKYISKTLADHLLRFRI